MKKYAYYPGCSLHSSASEYDTSMRTVAVRLGLDLAEIDGWICCGSTPAHMVNDLVSVTLPLWNLIRARRHAREVVVPCAACFSAFKVAMSQAENDARVREQLARVVGNDYEGIRVLHALEAIVNDVGLETIGRQVTRGLEGLRVASYYGCLLTRPPKVKRFDDPENPQAIDRLIATLGGEPVEWTHKTICCGASFSLTAVDVVWRLSGDILVQAAKAGAECIVVACPLCQSNLDLRQPDIERERGEKFDLPVLYFTQLLGLSIGCEPEALGLDKNCVPPWSVVERLTTNTPDPGGAASGGGAMSATSRGR